MFAIIISLILFGKMFKRQLILVITHIYVELLQ